MILRMVDRFIGCARTIALCLIHRQMGEPDTADKTLVCMIGEQVEEIDFVGEGN